MAGLSEAVHCELFMQRRRHYCLHEIVLWVVWTSTAAMGSKQPSHDASRAARASCGQPLLSRGRAAAVLAAADSSSSAVVCAVSTSIVVVLRMLMSIVAARLRSFVRLLKC
jgi:hypothetical protein